MIKYFVFSSVLFLPIFCSSQSYSGPPGEPGTSAIFKDSSAITAWAATCQVTRGFKQINMPQDGYALFGEEINAIGPAAGNSTNVVSLGDGGMAILTFHQPISNGPGPDFAVFENGFADHYMELAFVEVSSNGIDFYRFDSHSETPLLPQVSNATFGNCAFINNLAGKYRQGFGTPFDLDELNAISGLNINSITHIKLIDVVGSTNAVLGSLDSFGNLINDPFPTNFDSGGFDLDGVAVLNQAPLSIEEAANRVRIYPNPFKNNLTIDINEPMEITIFDVQGKIIDEFSLDTSQTIDAYTFLPGIYFVQLVSSKGKNVLKLVK